MNNENVAPKNDRTRTLVIGIAGASGSGKTTLCRRIVERLGESQVLLFQHDAYYHDLERMPVPDPARINYDHPDSLETGLCAAQLAGLRRGEAVEQPVYDFTTHRRTERTVRLEPRPVILVEGILVLAEAELRAQMDLRIFVDTDADICILRRVERDMNERGRSLDSVRDQYFGSVRPGFEQFVYPSRRHADLVVPHGGENPVAVDVILGYIHTSLRAPIPDR
jgi:uridine kinase